MNANRNEIRDGVVQALHEFLGSDDVASIGERTNPIEHLGKDSEDGVDFACLLSDKFDFHVPNDVNPFLDDSKHSSRSVGEMVDLMCNLLGRQKEVGHA